MSSNIQIWKDTKKYALLNYSSETVPSSIKYNLNNLLDVNLINRYKTKVRVLNSDTIDAAKIYHDFNKNPLVLNMADDCFPGGAVEFGSGAQEESIFRRSNYFLTLNLETGFYPLKNTDCIYSPKVTFFKTSNGKYCKPYNLSLIACPGIKKPKLENDKLNDTDKELLKNKIRTLFKIAIKHNHHTLILGALGCGAFKNPPEDVANSFIEVIKEFDNVFEEIVFAIIDNHENYLLKDIHQKKSFNVFNRLFINGY